jgi:methylaspartate ammonia-lyase
MTNQEKISKKLYDALMSKYTAEMNEAEATLLVYFNNPVGIGEHPQHMEEMDKMVEKLANAKDKVEALREFYKYN